MQNVKIGVIGVGFVGELHTRTLSEMPGVEVVGVADADVEKSKEGCISVWNQFVL